MKKGFTLVELLISISLLCLISLIIIFNIKGANNSKLENEYRVYCNTVKSAANAYTEINYELINDLYERKTFIYLKVRELIEDGLISENLINPYTGERIDPEDLVQVYIDNETGMLAFEYPITELSNDIYLKAVTVTMTTEDSFSCMQGAGTYALVLYDQDGNWINLTPENITRYDVSCTVDSNMINNQDGTYSAPEIGTYYAEYSYKNDLGQYKTTLRNIFVVGRTFEVTLDPTGGVVTPHVLELSEGMKYGQSHNHFGLPVPINNGHSGSSYNYYFAGWRFNDQVVTADTTVLQNTDHTLTAEWFYEATRGYDCNDINMIYNASSGLCEYKTNAKSTYVYVCPADYMLSDITECNKVESDEYNYYYCSNQKNNSVYCKGITTDYSYVCSNGNLKNNNVCESIETKNADYSISYSCPLGYTGGGSSSYCSSSYSLSCGSDREISSGSGSVTCQTTISVNMNTNYSCPSGYTDNGSGCVKDSYDTPSCPSGYSANGTRCSKVETADPTKTTHYSCPSGYSLDSTNSRCTKTVGTPYRNEVGSYCSMNNDGVAVDYGPGSQYQNAIVDNEGRDNARNQAQQNGGTYCSYTNSPCTVQTGNGYDYNYHWYCVTYSDPMCSTGSVEGDSCIVADTPTSTTSYSCPSGYSLTSDNEECRATVYANYTCPSGYSYSDGKCVKHESTSYQTTTSCPDGYSKSGNSCVATTTYSLSCDSGYSAGSNGTCVSTVDATVNVDDYSCPSGYTLSNSICSKTVQSTPDKNYNCPSGYTGGGIDNYYCSINPSDNFMKYICPGDISGLYSSDSYSYSYGYHNADGTSNTCVSTKMPSTYYYCNDAHTPVVDRNIKHDNQINCYIKSIN